MRDSFPWRNMWTFAGAGKRPVSGPAKPSPTAMAKSPMKHRTCHFRFPTSPTSLEIQPTPVPGLHNRHPPRLHLPECLWGNRSGWPCRGRRETESRGRDWKTTRTSAPSEVTSLTTPGFRKARPVHGSRSRSMATRRRRELPRISPCGPLPPAPRRKSGCRPMTRVW